MEMIARIFTLWVLRWLVGSCILLQGGKNHGVDVKRAGLYRLGNWLVDLGWWLLV